MATPTPPESSSARPSAHRASSHSHQPKAPVSDSGDRLQLPKRAQTFAHASPADSPDAFDTGEHNDSDDGFELTRASVELDILPIELITLTDRCVMSSPFLSTPPTDPL